MGEPILICPYCAEDIKDQAILCRYCGSDLPIKSPTKVNQNEGDTSLESVEFVSDHSETKPTFNKFTRMQKVIGISTVLLLITVSGLVAFSKYAGPNSITFTPLLQNQQITVPGVSKGCKSEDEATEIIMNFYSTDFLNGFDSRWVLDHPECFNDVILQDYAYQSGPEAQSKKESEAKEWVPEGYNISFQGTQVIEGFAQKFLKSGFKCADGADGCWGISVIARDGCPYGVFADVFYSDSEGNQKPEVREESTKASPMQKMTLVFNSFDSSDQSARIWRVGCN